MCPKRYKILRVIVHLMGDHMKIGRSPNKGLLKNNNMGLHCLLEAVVRLTMAMHRGLVSLFTDPKKRKQGE